MSKEAMKLALDALVYASSYCDTYDAITALREALAQERSSDEQPAQQALDKMAENARELGIQMQPEEPRAWFTVDELNAWADKKLKENPQWAEQPAQQEPVVFYRCNGCGHAYEQVHPTSCDCMEGSSFEKVNYYTSPQPAPCAPAADGVCEALDCQNHKPAQQEPVGRLESDPYEGHVFVPRIDGDWSMLGEDLYTAPPAQRKPLTDEEKDAARWRFLVDNSFDKEGITQFHVWEHSWEPHSQTGEPTEWKQRVRGPALDRFIDLAIEAAHGITKE